MVYKLLLCTVFPFQLSLLLTFSTLGQGLYYTHPIKQGFWSTLSLNELGYLGVEAYDNSHLPFFTSGTMGCEYPVQSLFEHIESAGIVIGALVDNGATATPRYSTGVISSAPQLFEPGVNSTYPVDTSHIWYQTSVISPGEPNRRNHDDDGDGKIDEDELDGIDNEGDGKIDEDYGAISESDLYTAYTDSFRIFNRQAANPHPLGVKIWMRSYAWGNAVREPILPIDYYLVNVGEKVLDSVFIGFSVSPSVGPLNKGIAWGRNVAGYWPELRTAFVYNPIDTGSTPLGISLLETSKPLPQLRYYFNWWPFNGPAYQEVVLSQRDLYRYIRGELFPAQPPIKADQSITDLGVYHVLFSFGPFLAWSPGETLKVAFAFVNGHSLQYGADNVKDNARAAITLYSRDYHPSLVLPSPKLEFETGNKQVTLRWGSSSSSKNPLEIWDDQNAVADIYPTDHWRRANSPPGHSTGGRIFEGYRLYRSEDPGGSPKSFTRLMQWDIIDSIGPKYEFDTGIESTYVDSSLQTGKTYWYAVTSFGIPDLHVIDYIDFDGIAKKETLFTKSAESSVIASRKRVSLPFSVSRSVGEVKVVPNPYRGDENYTFESGGWEGRTNSWNENKRVIRFIHLPTKCTLRIYSLVGEVITTIYHEDPVNGHETWNLLSESNRAIASGVYLFSVESDLGMQVGKFVVIR